MSTGHRGTEPAPFSAAMRLLRDNPGLRQALQRAQYVPISRQFQVPDLAGAARDGGQVYIDENVPDRLPSGIEPDRYISRHELAEHWLMTRLGWEYDKAHRYATSFEHMALMQDGCDPESYEGEIVPLIRIDEHERVTSETVPPDLYLGPYESDPDAEDGELLPILRAAQR